MSDDTRAPARLRHSSDDRPGIVPRRSWRGFAYRHADGTLVRDADTLERIRAIAIPPAWTDVWICPWPNGHLQATGRDAAGRLQYLYHPVWREQRDREKFERMVEFARSLPGLRSAVGNDLARRGLTRERLLACATRLLARRLFPDRARGRGAG